MAVDPDRSGGNVALINDPVDVIIDKLLRYVPFIQVVVERALLLCFSVYFVGGAS